MPTNKQKKAQAKAKVRLKKMNTLAKKYYKGGKGMNWRAALKKAGKEMRKKG